MTAPDAPSTQMAPFATELELSDSIGSARSNRRGFLARCFAAGMGLGLGALAQLPPARQAFASHVGYNPYEILSSCPSYAADHNCFPGCGPSRVHSDACVPDASSHYVGYHRRGGAQWKVRANQCYGGWADGWRWSYGSSCGHCYRSVTRRCHDGWKCDSSGANCYKTICRWNIYCG